MKLLTNLSLLAPAWNYASIITLTLEKEVAIDAIDTLVIQKHSF